MAVMAGCSQSTNLPAPQTDTSPLRQFFGIDTFEKQQHLDLLREQRISNCMRVHGFRYVPSALGKFTAYGSGGYLENLRSHGYGLSDALDAPPPVDPNSQVFKNFSPVEKSAYVSALDGANPANPKSADSSCRGLASGGRTGRLLMTDMQQKLRDMQKRTDADPRVRTINVRWSRCMLKSGYKVASRQQIVPNILAPLRNRLATDSGSGRPKPEVINRLRITELKIANTDAACSQANDLDEIHKVSAEFETELIQNNRDAFNHQKEINRGLPG